MRVAVVGARRARQGTGPYLARAFHEAGARVHAIVGTRPETVAEAQADLRARWGIEARGFTDTATLFEADPPDILVIATPAHLHLTDLERAAAAGVHVLCEKPLHWTAATASDPAAAGAAGRRLGERFQDAGRLLWLNAQWPQTLPAFYELFPQAPRGVGCGGAPPQRFSMRLSPSAGGPSMRWESLSHPISMLLALAGPGRARGIEVDERDRGGPDESVALRFGYVHALGETEASVTLRRCPAQPRPAGYGLDGWTCRREVELPSYRMTLRTAAAPGSNQARDPERSVALPDPLDEHVKAFLDAIQRGEATQPEALATHQRLLAELTGAGRR